MTYRPRARRLDNKPKVQQKPCAGIKLRAAFVMGLFVMAFCGLQVKLVTLGMLDGYEPAGNTIQTRLSADMRRGDIYDRNGELLATTLNTYSLYADPKTIMDVGEAVTKIAGVLPDMDTTILRDRLRRKGRFVWLRRNLTPQQAWQINALGLPGLGFRQEMARVYPHQSLLAHALGSVNNEGQGIAGVEATEEERLSQGQDVHLALDVRLQQALRDSLMETLVKTRAKAVWGISMEPDTGEIVAAVSLPDFDPNHYGSAHEEQWLNRISGGVYEMGSTFKLFTAAEMMDRKGVSPDQAYDCTSSISIGRFRIHDPYPKSRWLTLTEILRYSSNIGAARMADTLDEGEQKRFLDELHLLDRTDVGFSHVATALTPQRWKRIQTMTIAFGHGIAVSPVNMVAAVSTLVGDGNWREPSLIRDRAHAAPQRVVKPATVERMRNIMRDVVENGTATRAKVLGYDIGGKTGTAEKNENGAYLKDKHLASFVGVVPLDKPRLVTLIMVDEGYDGEKPGGGGSVAAPAFASFVRRAAPILGITPQITGDMPLVAEHPRVQRVGYETVSFNWGARR
ncbi:MAG: penicillin-binding protein 2 [Proteobacteria bacterium]|nr:penicillin-binding protein 2 [Pseudomonadota bacterium]